MNNEGLKVLIVFIAILASFAGLGLALDYSQCSDNKEAKWDLEKGCQIYQDGRWVSIISYSK